MKRGTSAFRSILSCSKPAVAPAPRAVLASASSSVGAAVAVAVAVSAPLNTAVNPRALSYRGACLTLCS
jgi:hypothetical protein